MTDVEGHRREGGQADLLGVLPAGTVLRGYELRSILGQGGFGITYRARDTTLDRDVAIKEYLPAMLAMREGRTTVSPRSPDHAEQFAWGRERFLDEARTLARFDDTPGIVRVIDFLEANGTAYMVMGLIEGETLTKRLLREQRLTPEAVERLLFPLLDGLEAIHATGFLHRDIKPANVMVDARGRPTLIDFGASRAAMAQQSSTMTAIFTPGYAAVEQFSSAKLGPWSDIYGLAATLYHAIAGHVPPSAIDRMMQDAYEPLSQLQPEGFPSSLLAGIDAGLAVRVVDRPQNVAEWRRILRAEEALSEGQAVTRVAKKPSPLARAVGRTKRARITIGGPALWGAAAAVILMLAGGSYLAFQGNAPAPATMTTLALSTEQLEQVLAERRRADALAAEKRQSEIEARKKAEVEADAKRQAEAALEQARQARQKAEDDLAKLRAEIAAQRQAETGPRGQVETTETAVQRAAQDAAQRKAEEEAAGLRQAEEEARKNAEAEAEAKRQADEALAKAEAERQRAEQEARQKAEAEAAAMRRASEETQRKAADAESRRQAEEAQAKARGEREKADADAKAKAEADKAAAALARQKEEAEASEKGLRLELADRERLQVALTALGFNTRGADGVLGPRSREMIAAWQKARNHAATGFLSAAQQEALLKEAATAVSKHDEHRKAEEEAKARAAPVPAAPLSSSPSQSAPPGSSPFDGRYSGAVVSNSGVRSISFELANGRGSGAIDSPGCGVASFTITISSAGDAIGEGISCDLNRPFTLRGSFVDERLFLTVSGAGFLAHARAQLTRTASATVPAPAETSRSPDGLWRGTYSCEGSVTSVELHGQRQRFSIEFPVHLANGSGTWRASNTDIGNGMTFDIRVSIDGQTVSVTRSYAYTGSGTGARATLTGRYHGNTITAAGRELTGNRECTLALSRA